MIEVSTIFLKNLNNLTVATALVFTIVALCLKPANGQEKNLEFILTRALAGSAIPTGLALLFCAFEPSLLPRLEGANLNVAVAGITLLFISIKAAFSTK